MKTVLSLAVVMAVIALPYLGWLPGWTLSLATVTAFTALSLLGLNLIFGVTGLLALGQAAFAALPGFAAAILQTQAGVPALPALVLGVATTVAIARLIAMVFVRLPGIYLAVGTLGFAFVVEGLARAFPAWTGGASGLVVEFPIPMGRDAWYALAVLLLALGVGSFALLVRGARLRTLHLVRQDELAAHMVGINVSKVKANVFTIGSAYSAVGGLMLSHYVGVLTPESGGVSASLEGLAMVVIGGAGALLGPLVGVAVVHWLFAVAGGAHHYELLVYGLGFFLVLLFAPSGLVGRFTPHRTPSHRATSSASSLGPLTPHVTAPRSHGVRLRVDDVAKHFGGVHAVEGVSFEVHAGQVVGLIGPNGAGKSTLFNCISGIEPLTRGRVLLAGTDVTTWPMHRRAAGIGRSFQVPRLVPHMSTLENIEARLDHLPGFDRRTARLHAQSQLAAFGLGELAARPVSDIALGSHKLIELSRAAAGDPPLLLLDEPAVGLTTEEVTRLAAALVRLKAAGAAILVVEHNIEFIAAIADEVVVMDAGRLIARGTPAQVMADPRVQTAYFGALA